MSNLRKQRSELVKAGIPVISCKVLGGGKVRIRIRRNGEFEDGKVVKFSQCRKRISTQKKQEEFGFFSKKAPEISPTPHQKEVYYWQLLETHYADGECPHCHFYPNPKIEIITIDAGRQNVHKCQSCGKMFRP